MTVPAPAARRPWSLRRTLLVWLLAPQLVLVPAAALLVYALAVRPALDALDRALTDTAVALRDILADGDDGRPALPITPQTERALRADLIDVVRFAVADDQGQLLGGDAGLLMLWPKLDAGQWRYFDATLDGQPVRASALAAPCGRPVQVCAIVVTESPRKRGQAERATGLASLAAAGLLAATLPLLGLWAVQRGLRPVAQASAALGARSLERLDPLTAERLPAELAPFVAAINALFGRLRAAADAQRAFVANASHQLRTPLATLLSESSQLLSAPHPPALTPSLQRLQSAAERGARVTQQLLSLARVEGAGLALERRAVVDLATLAREGASDWLRPSQARQQDLGFDLAPARVLGDPALLVELMSNLVDNAIRHAGVGAAITLCTAERDGTSVLAVEDDGIGLPAGERDRAWDRFHRGASAQGSGSGLGLAIVRDIARLHGAEAVLASGPGGHGLRVEVRFPRTGTEAVGRLS